MHSKVEPRARRVHGAQIKAKVLEQCRQPGASVSAVALAHGLNANLVRAWIRGRGLRRAGLKGDDGGQPSVGPASMRTDGTAKLQFVPVEVATPAESTEDAVAPWRRAEASPAGAAIRVEMRCGSGRIEVTWPATQAAQCVAWLRELGAAVLK